MIMTTVSSGTFANQVLDVSKALSSNIAVPIKMMKALSVLADIGIHPPHYAEFIQDVGRKCANEVSVVFTCEGIRAPAVVSRIRINCSTIAVPPLIPRDHLNALDNPQS